MSHLLVCYRPRPCACEVMGTHMAAAAGEPSSGSRPSGRSASSSKSNIGEPPAPRAGGPGGPPRNAPARARDGSGRSLGDPTHQGSRHSLSRPRASRNPPATLSRSPLTGVPKATAGDYARTSYPEGPSGTASPCHKAIEALANHAASCRHRAVGDSDRGCSNNFQVRITLGRQRLSL